MTCAIPLLLVLGIGAGCKPAVESVGATSNATSRVAGPYRVVHVSDGDTVTIRDGARRQSVRLIGVDTPEVKKPHSPVQCYGPEASAFTRRALLNREVWLEQDAVAGVEDRYGRALRYVRVGGRDGELFELALLREGYARQYAFANQRYRYRATFEAAESAAKAARIGMWSACE